MYDVKYKKSKDFFHRKISRVKGDGIVEGGKSRYFILDDETRIEIPLEGTSFTFSPGRFFMIKKSMEKELGQTIPI